MYITMADHNHPDQPECDRQRTFVMDDSPRKDSGNNDELEDQHSFHGNDATDSVDGLTATSSNSTTVDPMSIDSDEQNSVGEELDSSTSHVPIHSNVLDSLSYDCPSPDYGSSRVMPTPVNMNVNEISVTIEDFANTQEHIKERKYPVLPSIGGRGTTLISSCSSEYNDMNNDNNSTINQLDFTRERMEEEADFFADYRINTSKVKVTPRQNPLPPIQHTRSVSSSKTKR